MDRKSELLRRYPSRENEQNELSVFTRSGYVRCLRIRLSDCRSDDFPFRKICIRRQGGSKRRRLKSTALYIIPGVPIRSTNLHDYSMDGDILFYFETCKQLIVKPCVPRELDPSSRSEKHIANKIGTLP